MDYDIAVVGAGPGGLGACMRASALGLKTALIERQIGIMKNAGFSDEEIQENLRKLTDPVEKISSVMQQREVALIEENENT